MLPLSCSDYISCQSVGKKLAVVEVCVGKVDRVRSRHQQHHQEEGGAGDQHLLSQPDNKDIQPAPLSHSQQYGQWRGGEGVEMKVLVKKFIINQH